MFHFAEENRKIFLSDHRLLNNKVKALTLNFKMNVKFKLRLIDTYIYIYMYIYYE